MLCLKEGLVSDTQWIDDKPAGEDRQERCGKSEASVRGRAKEDEPVEEKSLEHKGTEVA